MTSRGVQTQLTEEQVRWYVQTGHIPPGQRYGDFMRALADAYLAQRETLRQIADPSYVGNFSDAEVVEIYRKWAAAVSVGSPETRETE